MNADEFWDWFEEYANINSADNFYMFLQLDEIFGTGGKSIKDTQRAIINIGLKGEDLIEYIECSLKL